MIALINTAVIQTPLGNIELTATEDALMSCDFVVDVKKKPAQTEVLKTAAHQLKLYFQGKLTHFDVPLMPYGTDFQKNVWDALLQIPYGETRSYQEIAELIGSPRATRAVGTANAHNPLCIFIPCHRVIRSSGEIGGYSGGLDHKVTLLTLEKVSHVSQLIH